MNLYPRSVFGTGEGGEGWNPHCNEQPTSVPTQRSPSGDNGSGWLRYDGSIKHHWTEREQQILEDGMSEGKQHILEDGMSECASERRILQFARISLKLHGEKSIRDVALRYKQWIDICGDDLLNGWAHMDAEAGHIIPNDEIDNARRLLFQQNDLILDQIIQNQKLQREDNIELFHHAYNNMLMLLACLNHGTSESVSENLRKLGSFEEIFKVLEP